MNKKVNKLITAIEAYQYNIQDEMDLHKGLEQAFSKAGIDVEHEFRLNKAGTIDFFCEGIGIELKVDGSPTAVLRQLHRYMKCDEIREIILVTTKNTHRRIPNIINSKSVEILVISPGLA